jgi:transposase
VAVPKFVIRFIRKILLVIRHRCIFKTHVTDATLEYFINAAIETHREGHIEPPRVCRRLQLLRRWSHDKQATNKFSREVRARAVRMVLDHEHEHTSRWATLVSIAGKIGCTAQTLHQWVGKAERDSGRKPGLTTDMAAKLKTLERENRELRQANEILRKANAYFAQAELDRRYKP